MASAYPSATTGAIGAILRGIQQDQNNSPLAGPPSSQPGSPVRNLVQGPLNSVEAPNSAHVIAVRPELNPQLPGSPATPGALPAGTPIPAGVVAPGGAAPAPGGVVAPRPFVPPTPTVPSPGPSGPSAPGPGASAPAAYVAPASTSAGRAVSQGQILGLSTQVKPLYSSPAGPPAPKAQNSPGQSRVGSPIVDLFQKLNPFGHLNGFS